MSYKHDDTQEGASGETQWAHRYPHQTRSGHSGRPWPDAHPSEDGQSPPQDPAQGFGKLSGLIPWLADRLAERIVGPMAERVADRVIEKLSPRLDEDRSSISYGLMRIGGLLSFGPPGYPRPKGGEYLEAVDD